MKNKYDRKGDRKKFVKNRFHEYTCIYTDPHFQRKLYNVYNIN